MAPGFQQQSYGDPSQLLQRVGAGLEPFEPLAALAEGAYAASGSSDWLLPWALSLWRLNRHLEAMEVLDRAPGASQQTTEYQVMRGMVADVFSHSVRHHDHYVQFADSPEDLWSKISWLINEGAAGRSPPLLGRRE